MLFRLGNDYLRWSDHAVVKPITPTGRPNDRTLGDIGHNLLADCVVHGGIEQLTFGFNRLTAVRFKDIFNVLGRHLKSRS